MGYEDKSEDDDTFKVQVSTEPSIVFYEGEYEQYMFEMINALTEAEHSNTGLVIKPGLGVRYLLEFLEETARLMLVEDYYNPYGPDDVPKLPETDDEEGEP